MQPDYPCRFPHAAPTVPKINIPGPAGALEADVQLKPDARALAVVCHPHSLHGGSMDNKVVTTVVRLFAELGASVVRFNFRGVGASGGRFDDGHGEGEDLRAVVEWLRAQPDQAGLPLWLAGFSFGSYVSARMASALDADRLLSIAPPVGKWDFASIQRIPGPWLVVMGDQDEIVDAGQVHRWVESVQPSPQLIRMPTATHFFHGLIVDMKNRINLAWSGL